MDLLGLFPFFQPHNWPYLAATVLALLVLVHGSRHPWLFAGLGGFVIGQMIGATLLTQLNLVDKFVLSAALGLVLGMLARVAMRPAVAVASFAGVGYLAFALCNIARIESPWNLFAFGIAGGIAVAALFVSFDKAIIFNSALAAAGLLLATMIPWLVFFLRPWNGISAIIVAIIAVIVGIIHQQRQMNVAPAKPPAGETVIAAKEH